LTASKSNYKESTMIIDINILKRLGKRFGVFPISAGHPALQAALMKPAVVFIKAPAGVEPAITGGGYQWDDGLNGYRFGTSQKLFLAPDGTTIWTFKDVLFRGLGLDSVQKWTSGDAEYPMGKANAFFIVYGKLTGQDLGEGETAGDNVPDGETEPGEGGGLATADDENAPPYSKQDIQKILKGEFPTDVAGPKASMDTAVPSDNPAGEEEPSAPMSGPPPSRLAKGNPPIGTGSEAEKIINTLYKQAKINPKSKLSKQNPIRLDSDAIIDLYQRAKTMAPEEGEKLIAFLKSGAVLPLEEGKIAKYQLESLVETIVSGIVGEVDKAKKKAKAKKASKPVSKSASQLAPDQTGYEGEEDDYPNGSSGFKWQPPEHSQMDWDSGGEKGNIPGRGSEQQWLEDLANKLWKDPEDIGHSHQGWKVKKVVPHGEGTKAYLLTLTKQYHKSRIFVNKNGKWFWTDPVDRHNGWQEVEGPQTEPSIEQEESGAGAAGGAGGMTTTSAVSPVTGPNAFAKKKKWTEKFQGQQEKEDEQLAEMTTTSGGGGSSAGTSGYQVPGAFAKKMNNRKGHIEVLGYKMTALGKKEYNTPADKLYESIKKNIHRMMREGIDGPGFPHQSPYIPGGVEPLQQEGRRTCPHCNMLAVNGIWTHEQGCPASKKRVRETAMGQLGPEFGAAQQHHDDHFFDGVPEGDVMINCEKCGEEEAARITKRGSNGSSWWWEAVCTKCGHTFGNDNV
jgi:hypothetical protein